MLEDPEVLDFVASRGERATYVTSVCTGSLVLGAAGLLHGYRATSHWAYRDLLPLVGAEPVEARVVEDRNRITGGGVTSGIDFGLTLLARLAGEDYARGWQLGTEYDPQPPFQSGTPDQADPFIMTEVMRVLEPRVEPAPRALGAPGHSTRDRACMVVRRHGPRHAATGGRRGPVSYELGRSAVVQTTNATLVQAVLPCWC